MTNEALQKFKENLRHADTIIVSPGKSFDAAHLLAGALLNSLFKKLGKKSSLEPSKLKENAANFLKTLLGESPPAERPENLLIKIDTKKTPVSELKYDKDGDVLKIILSGKGALRAENVSVEKETAPADLLLLVDPDEKETEEITNSVPHKEAVRLNAQERTLAEKTAELAEALFGEIPQEFASAFYALTEFENSPGAAKTKEKFFWQEKLLNLKPDIQKITQAKEELLGKGFWKLFGRALSRSEYETASETFWACLTRNDFEKTAAEESVLPAIFRELANLRPDAKFYSILWEKKSESKTISALVGGENEDELNILARSMNSVLASPYFLLHGFGSFSEAEIKIRSRIQQTKNQIRNSSANEVK